MEFSVEKMFKICKEKGYSCYYCGEPAETLDHFIPKKEGGTNNEENLIPSCKRCNKLKGFRTLEHFRELDMRRINKMPKFTQEHIIFLKRYGFDFPKIEHKFWFEKQGIRI